MQIVLNSIEELKELTALINGNTPSVVNIGQAKLEQLKKDIKPAAENPKKERVGNKKEEKVDSKGETPNVEVEVTGIDTTTEELPKDADIKGENTADAEVNITKEMVREKFNQVVKSGKQKEAKALIENLGAKKLSDVKPEDYAALIKEAEALL
ncbi:hypothetical protein C1H57_12610 [Clostridium sp. 2-1]|uniref:hypothetical protein n=1 Tax=Clostridium TaxID=1485 RepID=UPI000CDA4BFF|nr:MULTISPECIES: hypothetical protein [Clostridium]MBN7575992.1 hypothetical protein [Clostridium beijerinckii]MBN7581175.1 hypothetical protein [Clostridium beijerinckii]MBN7585713.1 hypothetical protein [Clostridium beijerinckii]MBO0521502.1 hypothetical protein [Clostridium beijerinckii]POO91021.1 hypothetical protein C1H57_12610 [Clostridium sp. 2-1]